MSDALHAQGTLAARVLLRLGTVFQYASIRAADSDSGSLPGTGPLLTLQVRQSVSSGALHGSSAEIEAGPKTGSGSPATLSMPLSWADAADPSTNPLLRRAAFELAEGFGFPTSVRPDAETSAEDMLQAAQAREQELALRLADAEESVDAELISRLEQDLKEVREQMAMPVVLPPTSMPTAVPLACEVRDLPAGNLLFGAYLSVAAGTREPSAGDRAKAKEVTGDPGAHKGQEQG